MGNSTIKKNKNKQNLAGCLLQCSQPLCKKMFVGGKKKEDNICPDCGEEKVNRINEDPERD